MLVDQLLDGSAPPLRRATPEEMRARISGPPPAEPQPFEELLRNSRTTCSRSRAAASIPRSSRSSRSRARGPARSATSSRAPATSTRGRGWRPPARRSSSCRCSTGSATGSGCPDTAGGTLLSGGSAANMTALAVARESLVGGMNERLVAYVSDQAHSSLARGGRVLGFRPDQVRVLPVGADCRLSPDTLRRAIEADARAGRMPFFVSANGGATNTGVVDPLPELAEVAATRTGCGSTSTRRTAASRCSPSGDGVRSTASAARTRSRSIRTSGCTSRTSAAACSSATRTLLRRAFEMTPAYLHDADPGDGRGEPRRPRHPADAHVAGAQGVAVALRVRRRRVRRDDRPLPRPCRRGAQRASKSRRRSSSRRRRPSRSSASGAASTATTTRKTAATPRSSRSSSAAASASISSTRVGGRYVLRMCILGHATEWEHVERVIAFLERAEVEAAPTAEVYERHPDVARSWLAGTESGAADLGRLPIFRSLRPDELERLAGPRSSARPPAATRSSRSGTARRTSTSCSPEPST